MAASTGRFSSLLLEGLDEYRRGNMQAAVRAWEEAYTLEPTNPRAREFLHSALERIYAQMGVQRQVPPGGASTPPLPSQAARSTPTPPSQPMFVPPPQQANPSQPPSRLAPDIRRMPSSSPPPHQPPSQTMPGAQVVQQGPSASDASVLLGGARDLISQKDFDGALELVHKVLIQEPRNAQAQKMREECEAVLTQQLESRLGGLSQRPRVLLKPDEIRWLDLDPRAGFVLAQIDGAVSYEDLYDICGLPRLDTVRILSQLANEKIIGHGKG